MSCRPLASETALVLSAGLGKRMRPLTASQPKPLIRVGGKALIDHALDKLDSAGVKKAVVNVHYLADALEGHLKVRKNGPTISISDERELLLETGGGMVKAAPMLSDPFFCLNSDNIWLDGPNDVFAELSQAWNPEAMDALLLMVPHARALNYRGEGDFHLDPVGLVSRRRPGRKTARPGRARPRGGREVFARPLRPPQVGREPARSMSGRTDPPHGMRPPVVRSLQ